MLDPKEETNHETRNRRLCRAARSDGVVMVATAHNAGHIFLPDGRCQLLGSSHDAPLVGQDRTQLDPFLRPATPHSTRSVSFVGHNGRTPIFPSENCTLGAPAGASLHDAIGIPAFAEISYQ